MKTNEIKALEKYEKQVQDLIAKNQQDIAKYQDSLKQAQDNLKQAKDKAYSALNAADPEGYAAACESVRQCEDYVTFFETKLEEAKTGSIISKNDADKIKAAIKSIIEKRREAAQQELDAMEAKGADILIDHKNLRDLASKLYSTIERKVERTSNPSNTLMDPTGNLRAPNIVACFGQRIRKQELGK